MMRGDRRLGGDNIIMSIINQSVNKATCNTGVKYGSICISREHYLTIIQKWKHPGMRRTLSPLIIIRGIF